MIAWKDRHGLTKDALRLIASRYQPPKIAVRRVLDMGTGRILHPTGRQHVAPLGFPEIQGEQTKSPIVAQGHADATAAPLVSRDIFNAHAVLLHPIGFPNLL